MPLKTENIEIKITKNYTKEQIEAGEPGKYAQDLRKQYLDKGYDKVRVPYKRRTQTSGNFSNIDNPIKDAPAKTAFALKTQPNPQYYLKFGYLLEYVKDKILLKIKVSDNHDDNPPIFDIDNDIWSNHMYSLPNQISLDPRICLVRNSNFDSGKSNKATEVFPSLSPFREADIEGNKNQNAAYPMNIYLNFNFIIECLKTDERGDVSIFDFLKSICDGLNKALGGINNLEPIIDEDTNTLKIIDTTPIPGYSNPLNTKKYTLQLYGYNKKGSVYSSNFIRKVDLKTAITPEFATMITIGATAGGYVKGVEATAFSKWNWGITDRFKTEFTPGDPVSVTPPDSLDEAEINYATEFLAKGYDTRYGFTSLNPSYLKLSSDLIEKNISIGTEFFKYIVAKNKSTSGGTIGFIPFKISFTMDGLSGIKIYNKLNVDTRFLPKAYGDNLDLIVTGVSHKLANNDWETDIEATVIPKTKSGGAIVITSQDIKEVIQEVREAPQDNNISSNWEIIQTKYSPASEEAQNINKIINAFKSQGINNPYAIVGFLCVVGKESGFKPVKEDTSWNAKNFAKIWGGKFSTTGKKGGNPTPFATELGKKSKSEKANYIYGVTPGGYRNETNSPGFKEPNHQGNGIPSTGDGYEYRGRGFNQVTWKASYKKWGDKIGVDLVNNPDLLLNADVAAKVSALWYFGGAVPKSQWKGKYPNVKEYFNKGIQNVDNGIYVYARATNGWGNGTPTEQIEKANKFKPFLQIKFK